MFRIEETNYFRIPFLKKPFASAKIFGNEENKEIGGFVNFYTCQSGILIASGIHNLPETETNFFAFHIHEVGECDGNFSSSGAHFGEGPHPLHAGDLPPLLSANGTAVSLVLTNKFSSSEIIGKAVIIHEGFDDFTTQPSGNSGARIACGIIKSV